MVVPTTNVSQEEVIGKFPRIFDQQFIIRFYIEENVRLFIKNPPI